MEGLWRIEGKVIPFSGNCSESGLKEREKLMGGTLEVLAKSEPRLPEDPKWKEFWEIDTKDKVQMTHEEIREEVLKQEDGVDAHIGESSETVERAREKWNKMEE